MLVPVIILVANGYVPFGDDALASIRSHQVLTIHTPGVGPHTTTATSDGKAIYDLGPLMFWLLAVPVRIAPVAGTQIGAAIIGAIALSVTIEAAWSRRQWLACTVVAFAATDALWRMPSTAIDPLWNAYFPLPFLIATMVVAWLVSTGSWGWMPFLVFTASVAMQTHMINVFPCIALLIVAPLIGLVLTGRPPRWRWAWTSSLVLVICWIAPIIQNFFGAGNLNQVIQSGNGVERLGIRTGFRFGAALLAWPPLFTRNLSITGASVEATFLHQSLWMVIGELVIFISIALAGWRWSNRPLAALSCIALAMMVGESIGFGSIPTQNLLNITYIQSVMWGVSILTWLVVIWAVLWAVSAAFYHWKKTAGSFYFLKKMLVSALGVFIIVILILGLLQFNQKSFQNKFIKRSTFRAGIIEQVTTSIEHQTPKGPVTFSMEAPNAELNLEVFFGVAWRLLAQGWEPGFGWFIADNSDLFVSKNATKFEIRISSNYVVTVHKIP